VLGEGNKTKDPKQDSQNRLIKIERLESEIF